MNGAGALLWLRPGIRSKEFGVLGSRFRVLGFRVLGFLGSGV